MSDDNTMMEVVNAAMKSQKKLKKEIQRLKTLLEECWLFFHGYENHTILPYNLWPSEMLKKLQEFKPKGGDAK